MYGWFKDTSSSSLCIDSDLNDLWAFCTFTENKWAEAYVGDMVYERVCGTKEVVGE